MKSKKGSKQGVKKEIAVRSSAWTDNLKKKVAASEVKSWNMEESINEEQLKALVLGADNVRFICVCNSALGVSYLIVRFRDQMRYLSTQRDSSKPRMFVDMTRMLKYLQKAYPRVTTLELKLE
jgi:hypothetical protein